MTIKDFAFVNEDNIVVNVVVIDDESDESIFTSVAQQYGAVRWLDTSIYGITEINGHFDGTRLWVEKPYESWVKGDNEWVAPVPYPQDEKHYYWDEATISWVEVQ